MVSLPAPGHSVTSLSAQSSVQVPEPLQQTKQFVVQVRPQVPLPVHVASQPGPSQARSQASPMHSTFASPLHPPQPKKAASPRAPLARER